MALIVDNEKNYAELMLTVNLFVPNFNDSDLEIFHSTKITSKTVTVNVKINNNNYKYRYKTLPCMYKSEQLDNKYLKRYGRVGLYQALSEYTGSVLPWGSLTGIRPTKLFYEHLKTNSFDETKDIFRNLYKVSDEKIKIVVDIINHQSKKSKNNNDIHLYIHIPFCPSKCTYCSFISYSIDRYNNLLSEYVNKLIYDIKQSFAMIRKKNYNLRTIYIGGGTPTILSSENLEILLSTINAELKTDSTQKGFAKEILNKKGAKNKKLFKIIEFTVESGRADTITQEKLQIMKKHGVTRICVNPQSFNKEVLKGINRPQNLTETRNAIKWSKELGFIVNMDLIAGLPGDSFQSFKQSLTKTLSFKPDNITVHTLAIKNASKLKETGAEIKNGESVSAMVDYAYRTLHRHQFFPYYLYRQKHMKENLENIGYSQTNKECVFNIDSMEEVASIIACGSGSISKRLFVESNKIERYAVLRDIPQYMENVKEITARKLNLFK